MFDSLLHYLTIIYSILLIRYLLFAGIAFLIFYIILRDYLRNRKIQPGFPRGADYRREIWNSIISLLIFALMGWLAIGPHARPYTKWYFHLNDHSWGYFIFTIAVMIVVHDTYFYWTHRLMHWGSLYHRVHKTHHDSINPSPWASFSFHPLEAVVESSVVVVFAFLLPIHPLALVPFFFWMTVFNIKGHLGYEMSPRWLTLGPLTKWMNTSTNHNLHHKYFQGNYGLYFRWWDVWMGTTHKHYQMALAQVQGRTFIAEDRRSEWDSHVRKLWMIAPYFSIGLGLLVFKNAWVSLLSFHACMITALVIHRKQWDFGKLWHGGRLLWLGGVTLSVLGFGMWLSHFLGQYEGYGGRLAGMMEGVGLHGISLTVFAIYFCAVNPVLEEAFWRGLFGNKQRRPILADLAYGCFHFFVLLPFTDAYYATVAAGVLVAMGYMWRQIANRSNGLALPVAWHALGDATIVIVVAGLLQGY